MADRFTEILDEIKALHEKKSHDYGTNADPYANVRASQEFGIEPWVGALVRMNDKITRLKAYTTRGELVNESAYDSICDIAVYAIIMRILYEEQIYNVQPVTSQPGDCLGCGKYQDECVCARDRRNAH